MAKKKKELSLEEKLEQALVPVDEQPYEVPKNWCWTTLVNIAKWGSGGTPSRKNKEFYEGDIPWIKTGELNDGYIYDSEEKISEEAISKSSAKLFKKGNVLIAMYGATIGKTGILSINATTNQACACADCKEGISNKFLFYYLQSEKNYFIAKGKGGAQPNISQEIIKMHRFPLPPVKEQERIVEVIESMFAKLDEAKGIAEETLNSFEDRRAAILHKGFTGELTSLWRLKYHPEDARDYLTKIQEGAAGISRQDFKFWKNDSLPDGWCESKIGNLLYFAGRIGWKGLKADEYTEEGPVLLSVYNLNDGDEVSYNRVYHITEERYEESPEIMVEIGDVLLTKDGAGIGKLGYVKELPQKATINSSLLLIRPGEAAISKYVYYILSGPNLQRIVKERITGSATPHLFQRDIKEFTIPVPSIEEQKKIVEVIDKMLEKEERARDAAESVVSSVDMMKKAILAKAFRGELGTNIESEESSIELLKSIFQEV